MTNSISRADFSHVDPAAVALLAERWARRYGVLPLREEDAYPAMPEDGYGWEKLFSERMCRHFTEDFGLVTRVARYHNVYGPYGTYSGGREKARVGRRDGGGGRRFGGGGVKQGHGKDQADEGQKAHGP